jgi:hypothetical protein
MLECDVKVNELRLNTAQQAAIRALTGSHRCVDLQQTQHSVGGTHLYVTVQGTTYHIAKSGNVRKLG